MKISYRWLKTLIELSESPDEIAALLTAVGLEVESVNKIEKVEGSLDNIVVGKVISCEKHPNAEKLFLTQVEVGGSKNLSIVCGASNVGVGLKVVVAKEGAKVIMNGKSQVLKNTKIRGEISEGMICAEDEIGLSDNHNGIIILDKTIAVGTLVSTLYDVQPEYVFEIGLTPNRGDAASHLGVARDLKALLKRKINLPYVEDVRVDNEKYPIYVEIEDTKECSRFCGVTIDEVTVKESPDWLKSYLRLIGLNPINNIVDITNFVCHELGQPLHAYDWDEISDRKIIVKKAKKGDYLTTLDKITRELESEDLVIYDGKKPLGIAGILGGLSSSIRPNTNRIFLECAHFNSSTLQKTSRVHQIKTDASFRFERGTDPVAKIYAIKRAAKLILEIAGGKISSSFSDISSKIISTTIEVKYENIKRLISQTIDKNLIQSILLQLDIRMVNQDMSGFTAIIPSYRTDIKRETDIIEEILRIYGFDSIPFSPHLQTSYIAPSVQHPPHILQKTASQLLISNGFFEIITNSLQKEHYFSDYENSLIKLLNPLSEDLNVMRPTLLYSGLEVISHNFKRKQKDLKLFEFGKIFSQKGKEKKEEFRLGLFFTGMVQAESWQQKSEPFTLHKVQNSVKILAQGLNYSLQHHFGDAPSWAEENMVFHGKGKLLMEVGKIKKSILQKMDIEQDVYFADIHWETLLLNYSTQYKYKEVSKFPEVRRDLALVIDKSVKYESIESIARKTEKTILKSINVFDVYEDKSLGENKKSYTLSFILQDKQTLTQEIIDKTMQKLVQQFEKELGAVVRS